MWSKMVLAATVVVSMEAQAQEVRSLFSPLPYQPAQDTAIRDDPARRKLVVPSIRAATNCVAREALNEPDMPAAYSRGDLPAYLANPIRRCQGPIQFMIMEYDRIYGVGLGRGFYDGPYVQDLPRAVIARVGRDLEQRYAENERLAVEAQQRAEQQRAEADRVRAEKQAEADRREADRRAEMDRLQAIRRADMEKQDAERRAEADRQAAARKAEAEQREAERKLVLERTESQRRAEQLKADDLKRQQLEAAEGANRILRDRVLECVGHEMQDLVKSGESAEILATATMTICSAQVNKLLEGIIEAQKIETGAAYVGEGEKSVLRNSGRAGIREQVLTVAVRAKAAAAKSGNSSF